MSAVEARRLKPLKGLAIDLKKEGSDARLVLLVPVKASKAGLEGDVT
jgi:hypothetical protein